MNRLLGEPHMSEFNRDVFFLSVHVSICPICYRCTYVTNIQKLPCVMLMESHSSIGVSVFE